MFEEGTFCLLLYAPLLRHHTRGARVCADLWMLRQQETVVTACSKTRCERGKKERKKDGKKARKKSEAAGGQQRTDRGCLGLPGSENKELRAVGSTPREPVRLPDVTGNSLPTSWSGPLPVLHTHPRRHCRVRVRSALELRAATISRTALCSLAALAVSKGN